jgi:hypothetical protein
MLTITPRAGEERENKKARGKKLSDAENSVSGEERCSQWTSTFGYRLFPMVVPRGEASS